MKKNKPIKIEINDTQINFSNLPITGSEIIENNNQVPVPLSELTQDQQIPLLIRPSFRQVNSPNKPLNLGLVAIPDPTISHAQTAPKPFTSGVFALVVISAIVFFDKLLPPILYVFKRKKKNRILELELSCPFSLHDTIMSAISKDDVCAGEVGSVIGIKYKPGP